MMYQGKNLYKWNWVGGGYNQCRADSKREAMKRARAIGRPDEGSSRMLLKVDEKSLVRVKSEQSFWANYPSFDQERAMSVQNHIENINLQCNTHSTSIYQKRKNVLKKQ